MMKDDISVLHITGARSGLPQLFILHILATTYFTTSQSERKINSSVQK